MSRAVLAVMAGLLCALAGVKHASSLKADAGRISRWVQLLEHLALLLHQGALSIPEALCAAADQAHPADQLLRDMASAMHASPLLSPADAFRAHQLSWQERDILARLFVRLGRGSRESRCLAVQQGAAELHLLAGAASEKAEKDAKMWQTLGFTGGICLTIMLL